MKEIETKLEVHRAFTMPDLSGAVPDTEVVGGGERHLRSTYWDTEDLRLARASITLRSRRRDAGNEGWQLKTELPVATSGLARREEAIPGHPSRPPRAVLDRVAVVTRGAPLVPVAKLHTRRAVVEVRQDGRLVAEVVDDDVSVVHGNQVADRFRELEVELGEAGSEQALRSLVGTLLTHGASRSDQRPKVYAVIGPDAEEPDDLDLVRTDAGWSAVAAVIAEGVRRLRVADPAVRAEDERGAAAALQAVLEDLDTALAAVGPSVRDPRRVLAEVAGAARRVAVVETALAAVEPAVEAVTALAPGTAVPSADPLCARLLEARARRGEGLVTALRDPAYLEAIDVCVSLVVGRPRATDPDGTGEARPVEEETGVAMPLRTRKLGRLWEQLVARPDERATGFAVAVALLAADDTPTKKLPRRAAALADRARALDHQREALALVLREAGALPADGRVAAGVVVRQLADDLTHGGRELDRLLAKLEGKRLRKLAGAKVPVAPADPQAT